MLACGSRRAALGAMPEQNGARGPQLLNALLYHETLGAQVQETAADVQQVAGG